jgi:hypothetical protein
MKINKFYNVSCKIWKITDHVKGYGYAVKMLSGNFVLSKDELSKLKALFKEINAILERNRNERVA